MPEGGDTIDLPIRRGQMQDRGLAETGPPRSLGGGKIADWRTSAPYNQPDDWIFGSPRTKGKRPYQPDMILQRGIVPPQSRQGLPNTSAGT